MRTLLKSIVLWLFRKNIRDILRREKEESELGERRLGHRLVGIYSLRFWEELLSGPIAPGVGVTKEAHHRHIRMGDREVRGGRLPVVAPAVILFGATKRGGK